MEYPPAPGATLHSQASILEISSFASGGYRYALNVAAFILSDTLAILLSFLMAGQIRTATLGSSVLPQWLFLLVPLWWVIAAVNGLLPGWGLGAVDMLRRQVLRLCVFFGLAAVLLFVTGESHAVSRLSLCLAWLLTLVLMPFFRMMMRWSLCKLGVYGMHAAIYGTNEEVEQVIIRLHLERGLGYEPVALYPIDPDLPAQHLDALNALRNPRRPATIAIVSQRGLSSELHSTLFNRALQKYSKVLAIPDMGDTPSLWISPRDLSGQLALEITQHLSCPISSRFKRGMDLVLTCLTLPLWGLLCGTIAALIWLEDRKMPIYKQERIGRQGKPFHTYKFRTMVPDAEARLQQHLDADPSLRAEWEANFKLTKDPRITRVGALLRKTSLDELPQLINVLRGEMALVGPRPLPRYHYDELPRNVRTQRERMRPGLTGLWQVSGRSDVGNAGMIRWDPYYVLNWSIWLDLVILVRTVKVVLMGSGAR